MPQISEDLLEEIREFFINSDIDHNNYIDRNEFGKLLKGLGADMSEEEIDIGFNIVDINNDSRIDLDEFVSWWSGY